MVTYNSSAHLDECLSSLERDTAGRSFELVVIDNASVDDSLQKVLEFFPHAVILKNSSNRGFAAAVNQGLRHAKGKFCLLMNPDTVLHDGVLNVLAGVLENDSSIAAAGCRNVDSNGKLLHNCRRDHTPLRLLLEFNVFLWRFGPRFLRWIGVFNDSSWYDEVRFPEWIAGSFLMLRGDALKSIGLLDEKFFMYAEEADWCRRARKAGWQVCYTPHGDIGHVVAGSGDESTARRTAMLYMSRFYYIEKWYGTPARAMLRSGLFMLLPFNLAFIGIKFIFRRMDPGSFRGVVLNLAAAVFPGIFNRRRDRFFK